MSKLETILAALDYSQLILPPEYPAEGQFVITGPQVGGSVFSRIGYCLQIRKGAGAFESDQVLLRHCEDTILVHENQIFYGVTPEQESMIRKCFESCPESEPVNARYSIDGKFAKAGFIVPPSTSLDHVIPSTGSILFGIRHSVDCQRNVMEMFDQILAELQQVV